MSGVQCFVRWSISKIFLRKIFSILKNFLHIDWYLVCMWKQNYVAISCRANTQKSSTDQKVFSQQKMPNSSFMYWHSWAITWCTCLCSMLWLSGRVLSRFHIFSHVLFYLYDNYTVCATFLGYMFFLYIPLFNLSCAERESERQRGCREISQWIRAFYCGNICSNSIHFRLCVSWL